MKKTIILTLLTLTLIGCNKEENTKVDDITGADQQIVDGNKNITNIHPDTKGNTD